jgi:hypothetical protein
MTTCAWALATQIATLRGTRPIGRPAMDLSRLSSQQVEAIVRPLDWVDSTFKASFSPDGTFSHPDFIATVTARFRAAFPRNEDLARVSAAEAGSAYHPSPPPPPPTCRRHRPQVPLLCQRAIRGGQVAPAMLVRFVGMVVNTHEPEWYARVHRTAGARGGGLGWRGRGGM